jgi:hypothetical protein
VTKDVTFAPRRNTVSPLVGGFLGLVYPAILVGAALSVDFRRGGDMGEFAAALAASVLFLVAAPTAWVMSFSFIDVTRFAILVFGVATSFPLWFLLGSGLARGASQWTTWTMRYAVVCISWTAFNMLVFAVVASLAT